MFRVSFGKFFKQPESRQSLPVTADVTPNALDILPSELKCHVFSFFQIEELPVTKLVSREFCTLAKNAFREKFKDPKQIMLAISTLPLEQVFSFIEAFKNMDIKFTNPHYTVICAALTTTDITKINAQALQSAIDIVSEEKKFASLLNGLRITKAAIDGDTTLVSELLKNRSFLKPYVNLSGAELTGIDLSDINLDKVNFRDAKLTYADFTKASTARANLDRAELTGTDLESTSCVMQ